MNEMSAGEFFSYDQNIEWNPPGGEILLRDGSRLEVKGEYWRIPTPSRIWSVDYRKLQIPDGPHLNSIKRWVAHNLRNKSVATACNRFNLAVTFFNTNAFVEAALQRRGIPYLAFSQGKDALGVNHLWKSDSFRSYYRWCHSQQFPFFETEVLDLLEEVKIGGNKKGEAVRSADPEKGPLSATEVAELAVALRAAYVEETLPIDQQAAIWLALAFGANAGQYALMRENDIVPEYIDGQLITTLVSVPRHKKRHAYARSEFAQRKANRVVGRVLLDLINFNEARHPKNGSNEPRPLFWRSARRNDGPGREEWEWHLTSTQFSELLSAAIENLCLNSRTGEPLKISPRRLRYTLASRMVAAGASPYALAAALDHSDLQNVGVYFDVQSDIIEHLDKAMAMVLADRAAKFAKIVECEDDAINGGRPGSRRYVSDREKNLHEPIGTCGHTSFCNVVAPYACYTCPKFQAWMDGPHELVLDKLIESRAEREQMGLDPRFVGVEDQLIIHVAEVIKRIAEIRAERGEAHE